MVLCKVYIDLLLSKIIQNILKNFAKKNSIIQFITLVYIENLMEIQRIEKGVQINAIYNNIMKLNKGNMGPRI